MNAAERGEKAMRALESLTPSGSEFVGDVERCVQHIRSRFETQHSVMVKAVKERNELRDRYAELERAAAEADSALWLFAAQTGRKDAGDIYRNLQDALAKVRVANVGK